MIAFCKTADIKGVMRFIDQRWKKNHILSRDKRLMDWQHYNKEEGRYNFILAKDGQEITGILGYIHAGNMIWIAMWKVTENAAAGLGLTLIKYLESNETYDHIGSIGINQGVKPLYEFMGYKTGDLSQYYMFNDGAGGGEFKRVTDECRFNSTKLSGYILHRYVNHPAYDYHIYEVSSGVIIVRLDECKECRALRIVDASGSVGSRGGLQGLMEKYDAEYIDCYNAGVDPSVFYDAGMELLDPCGDIIVPNYFAPFVRQNVVISYAFKTDDLDQYIVYKGDGDMDRPS